MNFKRVLTALTFSTVAASAGIQASAGTATPVTLIINFEASDAGQSEFAGIMSGVSDAMASEPGFVSAVVYQNVEEPNVYVLQEVWTSKAHHGAHFDRIVASGDWAHIKSLLKAEPIMGYYATNPIEK